MRGGAESGRCHTDWHDALPSALAFHGAGGGGWQWAQWCRAWRADGGSLYAADYSRLASQAGSSLPCLIGTLRRQYAARSGDVLLGASFGGLLACVLAEPLRAKALVLINPLLPADAVPPPSLMGGVRAWGLGARLPSTCSAVPELAATEALQSFRRWTDFSERLLHEARHGFRLAPPRCPILIVSSKNDCYIDAAALAETARAWSADFLYVPGSHVSPLLGRHWSQVFDCVTAWLREAAERTTSPSSAVSVGAS
jgi:hypothetical protein